MIRPPSFGRGLNVADTAQELLAHVVAHYEAAPPGTVAPLPARRAVLPGDPRSVAWDCEQLTISLDGIGYGQAVDAQAGGPGTPIGFPLSATALRHAVFAVSLVRCTPVMDEQGNPPSAEALNEAGLIFLRDCGLLSQAMVTFAGIMASKLDDTASVQCGVITPFGPSGGFHACDTSMSITVPELV